MNYKISVDAFDSTFAVKEDASKLTHHSGKRFKLFPFIANNNIEPISNLDSLVGRYLCEIEGTAPKTISAADLIKQLASKTEIDVGMEPVFEQVVRHMFFTHEGKIRPVNFKMLTLIPCDESNERRLADYLSDVLGDKVILLEHIKEAEDELELQSNALEKFALSELEFIPLQSSDSRYQRIINAVKVPFEEDFEYVLGARNRTRDCLVPLIEFYYFIYTAQTIMQLSRFLNGERDKCTPLYFCLEWEKTSQNRDCYNHGWNMLQDSIKKIFAHAIVLEILNQTEVGCAPVDYIGLQQLIKTAPGEDHRIAEEIKVLTERYRNAISDCAAMAGLSRATGFGSETADEIHFLFESVKSQFENSVRNRPYSAYADQFEGYCRKYLKRRGRSGMMLNISEETLIFLTKICIKDQERMWLNDVFSAFETRGIFLDNHSKLEVMKYYEKLNLIEKKSDSGDAQYVKRIL